ncbi:MAG: DMT family transporter [Alphaproteobacteria bacterium]|nr:DMT family transporter [Alphaproteobacteria bacterium]
MAVSDSPQRTQFQEAARIRREHAIGVICALTVVLLFSGFNIMSRVGSTAGFGVWDIAALRFAVGGLIMLPLFLRRRFAGMALAAVIRMAFLGGLGFALLAYAGFFLAPAAHGAVLLHGTLPLFTFAVSLLLGESVRRGSIPGVLLIALGIGLMAFDTMRGATSTQLIGDFCLLLAALCWSACGIYVKRAGIPAVQAAALVVVVSAGLYLPVYFTVFGIDGWIAVEAQDLLVQAIFQGALVGAVSIFVYMRSVHSLGPNGTALFTAAIPCVTTLIAIHVLGEFPGRLEWAGVGIVTLGMVAAFAERLINR